MSNEIVTKIAELEATLRMPGLPAAASEAVEQQLRVLRDQITQQQSGGANLGVGNTIGQTGDIVAGDQTRGTVDNQGRINGVAVGINLGTVIYGRPPGEDERRRLVWYLARMAAKLYRLPLRGLEEHLDQGEGLALPQVYVLLATESLQTVARGHTKELRRYYQEGKLDQPLKPEYSPNHALPDQAIVRVETLNVVRREPERNLPLVLSRSTLASEAVHQHQRLVLLGDPGSGKSTFLRYLAWVLARRGLDQRDHETALFGWDDQRQYLPIILPLRKLAGRLAVDGVSDATIYSALRDEIESYGIRQIDDLLSESLYNGAALLLFDGLDEVPFETMPNMSIDRVTTMRAVRVFVASYPQTRVVVTCRTRAFGGEISESVGWQVTEIAPFTLGQIRHFAPAFYAELATAEQLEVYQIERLKNGLIDAIVASPKLRTMAATPLLLAIMALVLYHDGTLPRDRPLLYERILELLLGQWDKVRDGQSLAEAIGQPDWASDRIRPLLDALSYRAHADVSSQDGRGRLKRGDVRDALIAFFETARLPQPWESARRCLDYFEQRSGLLAPDESDSYVFAHLTLQEHCAGRHMLLSPDAAELVMHRRADDRWREPIFLGLGVVQKANPALIDRILTDLIDREENGQPKSVERWQRDLILAAEIGQDRDWNYLRTQRVNVDRLQRDLRRGLIELLQDKAQTLPIAERLRAGFLLGDLGDLRVPITVEQWRDQIARLQRGETGSYFCRVDAGTYTIGSADDDPHAGDEEKPQHTVTFDVPFWIARYPLTNAQWQVRVQSNGRPSYYAEDADLNGLNQPVVGIQWQWCNDFCTWLSEQIGMTVRLPTEQEWEAAARGGDTQHYPWGEDWQDDRAATEEDQETRGARYTAPVGCYPAGAAPCGALDMAGNVWEWTASEWRSYPGAKKPFTEDQYRVLRGGSWGDNRNRVRCGARDGGGPSGGIYYGFRVVVAPSLAQMF